MAKELAKQTKEAFDFIQKLYLELSYFIKEIEGFLKDEPEEFLIGKPSGYGIITRTSSGLEPHYVENWLPRLTFNFFCPTNMTKIEGGCTVTKFNKSLKVIIIYILLHDKSLNQPTVCGGYIENIENKKIDKFNKFEHLMSVFSYNANKILSSPHKIDYSDNYCTFCGEYTKKPLYSINSSLEVKKLVDSILALYRK